MTYVLICKGVYRHGIAGVYAEVERGVREGRRLFDLEIDQYHGYQLVGPFKVGVTGKHEGVWSGVKEPPTVWEIENGMFGVLETPPNLAPHE